MVKSGLDSFFLAERIAGGAVVCPQFAAEVENKRNPVPFLKVVFLTSKRVL